MRVPMWRERFGRGIVHADIEPSSDVPFKTLHAIQGLRTLALKRSAMRFMRSLMVMVRSASSSALPAGVSYRSGARKSSFAPAMQSRFCIRIPLLSPITIAIRSGRAARRAYARDECRQPIFCRTEALRLLMTYLKSALKEGALAVPKLREAVVTHILDLVVLAISECARSDLVRFRQESCRPGR